MKSEKDAQFAAYNYAVRGPWSSQRATLLARAKRGRGDPDRPMRRMNRRRLLNIMVSCRAERPWRSAVPLLAAVGCGLVLALTGCSRSPETAVAAAAPPSTGSAYTLMQMNLCLSGLADCYLTAAGPSI